jgi:demethylmenaquinone methyltransferase/2-methoxy-6-polyprenyl-1,4-benzoquinol methylase
MATRMAYNRCDMVQLTGDKRARYVKDVFSRIAYRYDVMNRLMTGGQDTRWRQEVVRRARLAPGTRILDLGTGTGDLAREALRQQPAAKVVAADFTLKMMRVGQEHGSMPGEAKEKVDWCAADTLRLPFADGTFDVAVSGFLIRNVSDIPLALGEQLRVLKHGRWVVILDTTRPRPNLLSPFIWTHLHVIIPLLGGLVSGFREDYTYLQESTENYLSAEQLCARMISAGFEQVGFRRLMFGTVAIHWGKKP